MAKLLTNMVPSWFETSTPEARPIRACQLMAVGLAFHFFGYECARAASISLISSKSLGKSHLHYHRYNTSILTLILYITNI